MAKTGGTHYHRCWHCNQRLYNRSRTARFCKPCERKRAKYHQEYYRLKKIIEKDVERYIKARVEFEIINRPKNEEIL